MSVLPKFIRHLLVIICCVATGATMAQENEFIPLLIKNLKVDSCIVYRMVDTDSGEVRQVVNKAIFNVDGQISDYYTMPEYEEDEVRHKVYTYINGKPVLITAFGYNDIPIETKFIYKGGVLVQQTVSGFDPRDYVVFVDNEGRMLEKIGNTTVPEYDSITGDPTGKMIWTQVEEYLYKYNRFKKLVEETFNFYGKESYRAEYDYGPSGNANLQRKTIYRYGNKTPDTEIHYTYLPNNLLEKQQYVFLEDNFSETLFYEYYFAGGKEGQAGKGTPAFTPPPPPKMPKGKGGKVKDYKNPSF